MRWSSIIGILLGICMLSGCGKEPEVNPNDWVPEVTQAVSDVQTPEVQETPDNEENSLATSGNVEGVPLYSAEELYAALEQKDSRELADMLWENQRTSGLHNCSKQELKDKNLLTYYISSTEGDDNNSGRTPDQPKKTLSDFSGVSNVNVMLKCGDTFALEDTFLVGSNVILGAYGEGARPILDFYQKLDVEWEKLDAYSNIWMADLKQLSTLYTGEENRNDCNIGHLVIDGEYNWKRLVKDDWENYSYPEKLEERKDGAFAVDWGKAVLYLYSEKNPNRKEILYALPKHGLTISNVMKTEVYGLEITGAGCHGISLSQVSDMVISGCYIHHIGGALLKNRNVRYGNAVEVWENGSDVRTTYNIAEWIYDTCYTNQGNSTSMVQKDLQFAYNLGRFCFWGIETWGDGGSENEFDNIVYKNNILMHAMDITNRDAVVYPDEAEQAMDVMGKYYEEYPAYVTYRGNALSYPYNQMSLLNAANAKKKESLVISDNIFWGTNRLLTLLKMTEDGELRFVLDNNMFYAKVPEAACVFRYTDAEDRRIFMKEMDVEANLSLICVNSMETEEITSRAEQLMKEKLFSLAIGQE